MAGHNRLIGSLAYLAIALPVSLVFHSCGSGKGDSTESFNLAELAQDAVQTDSGTATATAVSSDDRFNPFAKRSGTDGAASAEDGDLTNQSIAPPPPPKPKLHVSLTDLGLDAVESLQLTFTKVDVEYTPTGGSAQIVTIFEGERTEDLISLSKGLLKGLGSVTLDPGVVTQVRLITKSAEINFKDEEVTRPVTVPSGGETGLKLIGNIPLEMGKEIELVIDFDVERSVHVTGSPTDPKVMLKPTLKVFSLNELHELDNLPEGNHKVLLSAVTDEKDPFSPGIPDWRPSRRPDQDIDFQVDVRETGELKPGPSETTYFTWRVSVASHQRGNTPGIVKEYSDIQCLAGIDCPANTLPSPMKFNVHVDFSGRETDATPETAFADGLYIYVVNTAVIITKAGKEPQGKGNPKGKGKGPIKRDPNMEPGKDDLRVVDRDKFYGSLRIDSRSPEVTNLAPIHRYIFSHPRPQHTILAVDPIDGEESFSGLNIATWKHFLNSKDIISHLPPTVELKEPERFASRGPDRIFQQIRSAKLDTTPFGVQEGLNKLTGEIEDNAENLGFAMDSSRTFTLTKFFVDTHKPQLAWVRSPTDPTPTPPEGLITNNNRPETTLTMEDPKPSSGLRPATVLFHFNNINVTSATFSRSLPDSNQPSMIFSVLEKTDPFEDGERHPRVATATFTPPNQLADGYYTLTGSVADRATEDGNAYAPNPPKINLGLAVVNFCVDTHAPNLALNNVNGQGENGATNSLDPFFSISCQDPFPSCGVQTVTLIATRTHVPGETGPIDIADVPCEIPLRAPDHCTSGSFQMSGVAKIHGPTLQAMKNCFPGAPLGDGTFYQGFYDFTYRVTDKATNVAESTLKHIALDVDHPNFAMKMEFYKNGTEKLEPNVFYTNAATMKIVADYHNGLSGVDPNKVFLRRYCWSSCSPPPTETSQFSDWTSSLTQKTATHAEGTLETCEGLNLINLAIADRAGNPWGDGRYFCIDRNPPVISAVDIEATYGRIGWTPTGQEITGQTERRIKATVEDFGSGLFSVRLAAVAGPTLNLPMAITSPYGENKVSTGTVFRPNFGIVFAARHLDVVARDRAGNESHAPHFKGNSADILDRPTAPYANLGARGVTVVSSKGASLGIGTGGIPVDFFPTLVDLTESNVAGYIGGNVFQSGQDRLRYLGGARVRFGESSKWLPPVALCVPPPPGLDFGAGQIFVAKLVADYNIDGISDFSIVDAAASPLCSDARGDLPQVHESRDYVFVQMKEPTSLFISSISPGSSVQYAKATSLLEPVGGGVGLFTSEFCTTPYWCDTKYGLPVPTYIPPDLDMHLFNASNQLLGWFDIPQPGPLAAFNIGTKDVDGMLIAIVRDAKNMAFGTHQHIGLPALHGAISGLKSAQLDELNQREAISALLAIAQQPRKFLPQTRARAVESVIHLIDLPLEESHQIALDSILKNDPSATVRATTAMMIGFAGAESLTGSLLDVATNSNEHPAVRVAAEKSHVKITGLEAFNLEGLKTAPLRSSTTSGSSVPDRTEYDLSVSLFVQDQILASSRLPFVREDLVFIAQAKNTVRRAVFRIDNLLLEVCEQPPTRGLLWDDVAPNNRDCLSSWVTYDEDFGARSLQILPAACVDREGVSLGPSAQIGCSIDFASAAMNIYVAGGFEPAGGKLPFVEPRTFSPINDVVAAFDLQAVSDGSGILRIHPFGIGLSTGSGDFGVPTLPVGDGGWHRYLLEYRAENRAVRLTDDNENAIAVSLVGSSMAQ